MSQGTGVDGWMLLLRIVRRKDSKIKDSPANKDSYVPSHFVFLCENLSVRQSQVRPGSAGRFSSLLTHETVRGDTLEAQGEGLNVRLILE